MPYVSSHNKKSKRESVIYIREKERESAKDREREKERERANDYTEPGCRQAQERDGKKT